MIDPHVKPKDDFTPATNRTAFQNADVLSAEAYNASISKTCDHAITMRWKSAAVILAVHGAALLHYFMNARKVK